MLDQDKGKSDYCYSRSHTEKIKPGLQEGKSGDYIMHMKKNHEEGTENKDTCDGWW